MYTTAYSPKALGISHSEFNNSMYMQAGYSKNKQTSEFDESLIDQLIASFSVNRKEYNFDESLIDQIIANFPDTLDSYMSKTPFNEITLFEILMGTYNS
tara:strand:+ start:120 stop:416 length:297 start_codon:yes stop_codon:yes gene_type:complete